MEESVLHAGNGELAIRLTPWDQRAFGMGTAEITRFSPGNPSIGLALLDHAQAWCRERGVRYLFGRFDAAEPGAKQAVLEAGHAILECSLGLSRSGFAQLPQVPARMRPWLRAPLPGDMDTLLRIAREDFRHGRFLEDPAIPEDLAARRTHNWVADLCDQGLLRSAGVADQVIGFHAERVSAEEGHADLLLTGVGARYAMLGLPLWVVALEDLAGRGVRSCSTLVSAANTGVMNLYGKLGFRYDKTLFGFRKYL